jgi:hypothetical protein
MTLVTEAEALAMIYVRQVRLVIPHAELPERRKLRPSDTC